MLAGIHLVLGLLLISPREWHSWKSLQAWDTQSTGLLTKVTWQEGLTVQIDPCDGGFVDYAVSPEERIVQFANLPAWAVVGWANPCPPRWTVAGLLRRTRHPVSAVGQEIVQASTLDLLIPVEWFFIGGFPLIRLRSWWAEPGALITGCSVAAGALVVVSRIVGYGRFGWVSEFPVLAMPVVWLWWLALLAFSLIRQTQSRFGRHTTGQALRRIEK